MSIWYYVNQNGEQVGPVNESQFQKDLLDGKIQMNTLVWTEGMSDWTYYEDIASKAHDAQPSATTQPTDAQIALANPAGFWIRAFAFFIDGIVILFIYMILGLLFSPLFYFYSINQQTILGFQLGFSFFSTLLSVIYETVLVGSEWNATVGKKLLGIEILDENGKPLSYGFAFWRHVCKVINSFTLGIGYLIAAFDPQKRALHDFMAQTRVVHAIAKPSEKPEAPPPQS